MHQKRLSMNKLWPIPKKGKKFVVVPRNNGKLGIPVLVAMRDILKHVETRKELKKVLLEGKIEVNGYPIKDERYSLVLFDSLSIPVLNKYYKVSLSKSGKIIFEESNEKEANRKITKVVNKKLLSENKMQFNMIDGINIISKEKINICDSVIINLKDKKIEKILPIKEKSEIIIIKGKHLGHKGKVLKISNGIVKISLDSGEVNLNKDAIMVLD